MGFSQADWEELQRLQGKLGRIRYGPRQMAAKPIQLSFLPPVDPPKRPRRERVKKPPDEPGYERFQLRLW